MFQGDALGVACGTASAQPALRRERRTEDHEPALVRAVDQLLVTRDELLRADLVARIRGIGSPIDVVDALEHDDVRDARLHQHVAVESLERARLRRPGESTRLPEMPALTIALTGSFRSKKSPGKDVGPAGVRVGG